MPRNYSKEVKRYMTKDIIPEYPTESVDEAGRNIVEGPVDVKKSNKIFKNTEDDSVYDPDDDNQPSLQKRS